MTTFESLGVTTPILRALAALGFEKPTEIQAAAIPVLREGNDVIGIAQTGSGKTAAFVIPFLERIANFEGKPKPGMPRALILAPTRELAIQITEAIKSIGSQTPARICTVFGGVPYRTQVHILRRGVDIIVATPGRLQDHMKQGNIYLDETEYFVLDEADRMLDMGFVDEVRQISRKLPHGHQSVMFSATMNAPIQKLAETLLNNPIQVKVDSQGSVTDNLDHRVMLVPGHKKRDLLLHVLDQEQPTKGLVFVRTRRDADDIAAFLAENGYKTASIHGDKQQKVRIRTINNFKSGLYDFLVATDVAARGIDVKDISHVINFDTPVEAESYIHRIGRTARGSAHGRAITLTGKSELGLLRAIESLIKQKIERDENHPYPMPLNQRSGGGKGDFNRKRPSAGFRNGNPSGGRPAFKSDRANQANRPVRPGDDRRPRRDDDRRPRRDDDRRPGRAGEQRGEGYQGRKKEFAGEDRFSKNDGGYRQDRSEFAGKKNRPAQGERFETRRSSPKEHPSFLADDVEYSSSRRSDTGSKKSTGAVKKHATPAGKSKKSSKKRPAIAAKKAKAMASKQRGNHRQGGEQTLRRRAR